MRNKISCHIVFVSEFLVRLGWVGDGIAFSKRLLLILLSQAFTLSSVYGDVMFDKGLCKSNSHVDIGMQGAVLGSFYFEKTCIRTEVSNEGLTSKISLRLNYKKLSDGSIYIYNDPSPNNLYVYINITPTLNSGFIKYKVENIIGREKLGRDGLEDIYDAGKYSAHSFDLVNPDDQSYYTWCVSGGACGRVSMLTESLIFEVVMPGSEISMLPAVASEAASYLKNNAR